MTSPRTTAPDGTGATLGLPRVPVRDHSRRSRRTALPRERLRIPLLPRTASHRTTSHRTVRDPTARTRTASLRTGSTRTPRGRGLVGPGPPRRCPRIPTRSSLRRRPRRRAGSARRPRRAACRPGGRRRSLRARTATAPRAPIVTAGTADTKDGRVAAVTGTAVRSRCSPRAKDTFPRGRGRGRAFRIRRRRRHSSRHPATRSRRSRRTRTVRCRSAVAGPRRTSRVGPVSGRHAGGTKTAARRSSIYLRHQTKSLAPGRSSRY